MRYREHWRGIQWDAYRADVGDVHHCRVCEEGIERRIPYGNLWQRMVTRLLGFARLAAEASWAGAYMDWWKRRGRVLPHSARMLGEKRERLREERVGFPRLAVREAAACSQHKPHAAACSQHRYK